MFRVALIGLGYISETHLKNFTAVPDVQITAIADIDSQRLDRCARNYSVSQKFLDYRQLLELKQLDLVVVCLPNHLHAEATIAALNSGHHVLCEKPIATTLSDAEAMVDAARINKKTLSVAMNFRWQFFGPDSFYLRNLIQNGQLGQIYYTRVRYLRQQTFPACGSGRWNLNETESGGGVLIDLGPHMLDLAMWLMDDYSVRRVSGITHSGHIKNTAVESFASGVIVLGRGTRISMDLAWNCHNESVWQLEIYGEEGGAIIEKDQPKGKRVRLFSSTGDEPIAYQLAPGSRSAPPEQSLQEHVINRLALGQEPDCSGELAVQVMRAIDAWYQSDKNGKEVII